MPNRLAKEASPYLQQHANNPVDWYPWGEEALARAKREDKPIMLSIGYSACHWCHVMEHESFSDEETAKLMNARFVNIKVDREERPDLDQIYQMVVQLLGRGGGWPLTVFLTPDQKPFFGGTYFPNRERYGMPSFKRVLEAVSDAYEQRKDEVAEQAGEIVSAIAGILSGDGRGGEQLDRAMLGRAAKKLVARFDDRHGGFGDRPKFPNTTTLEVLAIHAMVNNDERAKSRVKLALDKMRAGGIWDHLGGGFHRYSTDERWLVPHFEKMLYDNALLLRAYVDGYRIFGDPEYAATARSIVGWLAREMTDPQGAFYSAQDADSEGQEGKFFVWSPDEVREAAGDAAEVALAAYGVTERGNFEESGKSVLYAAAPPRDPALHEKARARMWEAREKRVKPFRDEKILTSWNALMIGALADASMALDEPEWLDRARRAYDVISEKLSRRDDRGLRLARLMKDGAVKGEGFLDDHAYLANAALDLHEATGEARYLEDARALADTILARFSDAKLGGFFFTPDDGEALIVRARDTFDTALPSGSSSALRALLRLGSITDARYMDVATRELERCAGVAIDNPFGFGHLVVQVDRLLRGSVDVVLVGTRDDTRALARVTFHRYVPHRNVVWIDPNDARSVAAAALIAEGKTAQKGACAYVCRDRTCSLPITRPDDLVRVLRS